MKKILKAIIYLTLKKNIISKNEVFNETVVTHIKEKTEQIKINNDDVKMLEVTYERGSHENEDVTENKQEERNLNRIYSEHQTFTIPIRRMEIKLH